jgi:hypothetical protein
MFLPKINLSIALTKSYMNKRITTISISAALVLQIVSPAMTLAQTADNSLAQPRRLLGSPTTSTNGSRANFCTNIKNFSERIERQIADFDLKRAESNAGVYDKKSQFDQKLSESRNKTDLERLARYQRLNEFASSTEQKMAIGKFQSSIELAVAARKTAVDYALQNFRTQVKALVDARKTALSAAVKKFEDTVKAALSKAQSDCDAGVAPQTIRAELVSKLTAARERLAKDRSSVQNIGEQVKPLIEERKASTDKAFEDFKTETERARQVFRDELEGKLKPESSLIAPGVPLPPSTTTPSSTTSTKQ